MSTELIEKDNSSEELGIILNNSKLQLILKRFFDLLFSTLGLLILVPLFLFLAIIIKLDSTGPVFFTQVRIGKDSKEFKIFKFRTMYANSENEGLQLTVSDDSRITGAGKKLRKLKLDELPQLYNVLIGDMSLVGPRPEVSKYVAMYTKFQKNILRIRPGITDYASIMYFDENSMLSTSDNPEGIYINTIMPEKIKWNLKYLYNISLKEDIHLIFLTLIRILSKRKVLHGRVSINNNADL